MSADQIVENLLDKEQHYTQAIAKVAELHKLRQQQDKNFKDLWRSLHVERECHRAGIDKSRISHYITAEHDMLKDRMARLRARTHPDAIVGVILDDGSTIRFKEPLYPLGVEPPKPPERSKDVFPSVP